MKSLKITKTENQRVGYNENDIEALEYTEVIAQYDENDHLIREERYNMDGELNTLTLNTYDGNLLMETQQFDQDDILLQKTVNYYDEKGVLVQQGNYFGEDDTEYITKHIHDDNGNLVRVEMYDGDELDYVEREMEYDEKGLLTVETENDDYGNVMYVNKYSYNEQGLVTRHIRDEIQNKDRRTYDYTYDEMGNRIKDLIYDYGNSLIAKVYRSFDENNRQVMIEEEDLDSYRKIVMEYEEDLVVKNSLYNKEGVLIGWAEYTYNEDRKENAAREYIQDEVKPESYRMLRETHYIREN